jgi:hypothetical protein
MAGSTYRIRGHSVYRHSRADQIAPSRERVKLMRKSARQ